MTASVHTRLIPENNGNVNNINNILETNVTNDKFGNKITPLIITSTLTFFCGIFQVKRFEQKHFCS